MQSVFLTATNSTWYTEFLKPVLDHITNDPLNRKILDIGTGPGTLPRMLVERNADLKVTGIDVNHAYIDYAQKSIKQENISFLYQRPHAPLNFSDNQFDVVTFCSVLFLLNDEIKGSLLREALRVLKPQGKILILSPSGKKEDHTPTQTTDRPENLFSGGNWTYWVWKTLTSSAGRKWQEQKWLKKYANEHHLNYQITPVFDDHASLEIISSR